MVGMQPYDEDAETLAWRKHRDRQRGRPEPLLQPSDDPDAKKKIGEILYCHATRKTRTVDPGHWFFHTGEWAQCAEASKAEDGQWQVRICFAPHDKKLPEDSAIFNSIEEAQQFVSKYFDVPVVKVKPSDFPDPKNL